MAALHRVARVALLTGALLMPTGLRAQPEERSSAEAVFVGPGVAILWGVLLGPDETGTLVVLWIERFDAGAPWRFASVEAVDPFTRERDLIRLALNLETDPVATVEMSREGFVAKPGRRILFFRDAAALQDGRPGLTISYVGIPDRVPEFASRSELAEYLRHARERYPGR